ncbi:hypothetical protein Lmor_0644 [Legionella moravica]|uniref:Uncharacterized protein n=1 Tax=Legionella moravica TaxID=39962 RepID=A0ABR5RKI2_9GAMM|nr:hypothetical protein Lmor_0644 [Legionella moravica]
MSVVFNDVLSIFFQKVFDGINLISRNEYQDLAERQGFEPWEGCPSTVFKTAAFDRSATSPTAKNTILTLDDLQMVFEIFIVLWLIGMIKVHLFYALDILIKESARECSQMSTS